MNHSRWQVIVRLGAVLAAQPLVAQSLKVTVPVAELEARAQRDSNDAAAHYNLAMGYLSKERFGSAESSLRQAIALDPQFADAYLALAVSRAKDGDFWRAKRKAGRDTVRAVLKQIDQQYTKAFLLDPLVDVRVLGSIAWLRPWGDAASGLKDLFEGKYRSAYQHFSSEVRHQQKGGTLDDVSPVLLWFRSLAAAHSGLPDSAAADLQALVALTERQVAVDSAPDDAPLRANEYRYLLAAIWQRQGRTAEAIELYHQVITADIGNYMAHVQLARMYEATRDYPHAVQERMSALDANPEDPSLLFDLGVTLGKAGMLPQAGSRLKLTCEANPRDPRPYYWLGVAQMDQGKSAEARATLTRFLELAPSRYDRQITMAKERLAKLQ